MGEIIKAKNVKVFFLTLLVWVVITSLYAYQWTTSLMSEGYGYEQWWVFPFAGFLIYRLPILIMLLAVILLFETFYFNFFQKKS